MFLTVNAYTLMDQTLCVTVVTGSEAAQGRPVVRESYGSIRLPLNLGSRPAESDLVYLLGEALMNLAFDAGSAQGLR